MRSRRLLVVSVLLLLVVATRTPGAALFWLLCGALVVLASWRVPESALHRSRPLEWEATLERAAEGWPTARDRFLIRRDQFYRGAGATVGVFLILYGLASF